MGIAKYIRFLSVEDNYKDMGITKYIRFLSVEDNAIADMRFKFALEEIALDTQFVCAIIGNRKFPKVSFFKQPINYIFDKTGERAYKGAVKDLINNLGGEEFEKEIALSFLKRYKEEGAYIPEAILNDMNKNVE